jgi:hypothetical protein
MDKAMEEVLGVGDFQKAVSFVGKEGRCGDALSARKIGRRYSTSSTLHILLPLACFTSLTTASTLTNSSHTCTEHNTPKSSTRGT